jgi:hypothetical protein
MTWWNPWTWGRPANGAAVAAQREQEAKLREFRARAPEVRRELDKFVAEVEAAMARRRHR